MAESWDARSAVEHLAQRVTEIEGAHEGHEDVCSVRYAQIDKQLTAGSVRMEGIDNKMSAGFREIRTLFYGVASAVILILLGAVGTLVYDNLKANATTAERPRL